MKIGDTLYYQSSFFRPGIPHNRIVAEIAERAKKQSGPVRILDIGCAAGQNAFSVAALAAKTHPQAKVEIVGIDHNQVPIEQANDPGHVYSVDCFEAENVGKQLMPNDYFRPHGAKTTSAGIPIKEYAAEITVGPKLRKYTSFVVWDILKAPFNEKDFDYIFLFNLLMHFTEAERDLVIKHAITSLKTGGALVLESSGCINCRIFDEYYNWRTDFAAAAGLRPEDGRPGLQMNSNYYWKPGLSLYRKIVIRFKAAAQRFSRLFL